MKKLLSILIFASFAFANVSAKEIKGDTVSFNGVKLIRLNGTHAERGYTYGRLLAKEIFEVYNDYFVNDALSGIIFYYDYLIDDYKTLANVQPKFMTEAEAIVEGIKDSEYSDDFDDIWGRPFNVYDLLFANSIVELSSNLGCSSLMSWGDATMQDTDLIGEIVITRHLDWKYLPTLYKNHLIVAHNPAELDEQKWVSIGVVALIGGLSGVNESGLGVFQHMGNINQYDMESPYEPILLTLRNALELKDYNGDGLSRTDDVYDAVNDQNQAGSFIVDAVNSRAHADSAIVIECTFDEKTSRSIGDHSQMAGTNLVATNHFRKLFTPEECDRYDKIQAALLIDSNMTIDKNLSVLNQNGRLSNNMQVIQYIPSLMKFRTSFSDGDGMGWSKEPFEFNFNDLFVNTSVVELSSKVSKSKLMPNPSFGQSNLEFTIGEQSNVSIDIISVNGNLVKSMNLNTLPAGTHTHSIDLSDLSVGGYFVKIRTNSGSITNKLVVIK